MIAATFRLKATVAGRPRRAVGRDPVTKCRVLADKRPVSALDFRAAVDPCAFNQCLHSRFLENLCLALYRPSKENLGRLSCMVNESNPTNSTEGSVPYKTENHKKTSRLGTVRHDPYAAISNSLCERNRAAHEIKCLNETNICRIGDRSEIITLL